MRNRLLIVSLGGALTCLYQKKISSDDLKDALFFLDHTEDSAVEYLYFFQIKEFLDIQRLKLARNGLIQALTDADATSRIVWEITKLSDQKRISQMELLVYFLKQHTIPNTEPFLETVRSYTWVFNNIAVQKAIKKTNLPVTIIWANSNPKKP